MTHEPRQPPAAETTARSSLAVLAFVALCLAALAASPVLMIRQLDAMRDDTEARVGPIRDSIFRYAPLFSDVVVAHQSVRIGEAGALERYRGVRDRQRRAVAALARPVSPAALRHARELQRWNDEWLRHTDGRAEGRITEAEFLEGFGRVALARDSVGARLGALGREVQRVDARSKRRAGGWCAPSGGSPLGWACSASWPWPRLGGRRTRSGG